MSSPAKEEGVLPADVGAAAMPDVGAAAMPPRGRPLRHMHSIHPCTNLNRKVTFFSGVGGKSENFGASGAGLPHLCS